MNNIDFDLNLLKIFVSVYENGGIVLASKKLFISQPAVTISIKKLENAVGTNLFIRLPKGVKPTIAGEKFYDFCKKAIKQIELAIENTKDLDNLINGHLNIGASHDLINYFLMPKIIDFTKKYPNVSINFVETIPNHLSKYIERGDIDIVFLENKKLQSNFECFEVTKFDNCFFSKNNIDKLDEKINLAIFKQNTGNYESFEDFCENNIHIKPKYKVANFDTMSKLVEKDLCVGFAPQNYIDKNKCKLIKVDYKIQQTTINMCYLKEQNISYICKEFIKQFR